MPRLIAIKAHGYAGITRRPGQSYECEQRFAGSLIAAGVARYDDNPILVSQRELSAEDSRAEYADRDSSPDQTPVKPKRRYRRKDMTAEKE